MIILKMIINGLIIKIILNNTFIMINNNYY